MQQSTPHTDILNTQSNAFETPKQDYSELITRERIEGTPFTLIQEEGKGYYLVMGNFLITHPTISKTETMDKLEKEKWNIMLSMIIIVINKQTGNQQ